LSMKLREREEKFKIGCTKMVEGNY